MSSILKALKKVEEEKAAQRLEAPLASDVTRTRSRRPHSSRSPWTVAGACAFVAVAAVVSTYAAMGGLSSGKKEGNPTPTPVEKAPVPDAKPQQAPVASPQPSVAFASAPIAGKGKIELPAVLKKAAPLSAQAAPSVTTGAAAKPTAVIPVKPAVAVPAMSVTREPQPFIRTSTGAISLQHSGSDFKVSGIAWQKESASRLAIVNGLAVGQGATVDGARVLEILPDRVRLSRDNQQFEIHLGRVSQ